MRLTEVLGIRRIINSSYHPYSVIPKPSIWPKRERLRRFIAWQYGSNRTTVRKGQRQLDKIFHYMDMHRRDELKMEKYYAETRLNAALDEHHFEYRELRSNFDKAHILLDNIVLSQLAIYEPRTFKSLVDFSKQLSLQQGHQIIYDKSDQENIELSTNCLGLPFPKSKYFPRGAGKDHRNPPRKLREDEY
uniref:Uncharacterized protein n=1 Tax=Panagrolaimus sp. ES5 TaxID=591445 RepID=A0AC34GWN5_9BILA